MVLEHLGFSIGRWCFASDCMSWQGSDERDSSLAEWDVYACSKALKALAYTLAPGQDL